MRKEVTIQLLIEFSPMEYRGAVINIPKPPCPDIPPVIKEVVISE